MTSDTVLRLPDYPEAQEWFQANGLTDGLPIVPPTPDCVDVMIEAGGRARETVVGTIDGRTDGLTVEQAAVCAVMAGAMPMYFPVILATWDAIFEPAFNAGAVLGSSGGTSLTAVVSGPLAAQVGMNAGHNVFGPGNRANATIGRAVRLGLMNALGYRPGALDGAAFGSQARYTAHFAEDPPEAPWEPLRVRLGFAQEATTVTVAVTDAPRQVTHILSGEADNVLRMFSVALRDPSHCAAGRGATFFVVIGPEHATILREAGWTQRAICEHLAETSRITPEQMEEGGAPLGPDRLPVEHGRHMALGLDGWLPTTTVDDVLLVTAGGTGAGWSHVIFGYAPSRVSRPVTKEVSLP